jgi:hypothetical protein
MRPAPWWSRRHSCAVPRCWRFRACPVRRSFWSWTRTSSAPPPGCACATSPPHRWWCAIYIRLSSSPSPGLRQHPVQWRRSVGSTGTQTHDALCARRLRTNPCSPHPRRRFSTASQTERTPAHLTPAGASQPRHRLNAPQLTSPPQALLDRVTAAATCAQTIRAFGRRVRADPQPTPTPSPLLPQPTNTLQRGGACGPTVQALAGCLDAELDAVMVAVRSAEQRLCTHGTLTPPTREYGSGRGQRRT